MFRRLFYRAASQEIIQECVELAGSFAVAASTATRDLHIGVNGMRRDLLTLFTFGGVHVVGQQRKLNQPEVHAVAITVFIKHLGWTGDEAVIKAQGAISAAGPDGYADLKAVIHKGIDGFLHWEAAPGAYDAAEFAAVLAAYDKPHNSSQPAAAVGAA